jgi:hypothetical protein
MKKDSINLNIQTIVLHAKNVYYYNLIVNNNEPTSIKYSEIINYLETLTISTRVLKTIRDLLKDYKSFIFFVRDQRVLEVEEKKENIPEVKKTLIDNSMNSVVIEKIKSNTKEIKKNKFNTIWQKSRDYQK